MCGGRRRHRRIRGHHDLLRLLGRRGAGVAGDRAAQAGSRPSAPLHAPGALGGARRPPEERQRQDRPARAARPVPPRTEGRDLMETDTRPELRAQVAEVVSERAGIDVPETSTDLLEAGLIDSLALVTLIVALEETFGVQLPLDDFDVDHFRSVDAMADFLASVGAVPA